MGHFEQMSPKLARELVLLRRSYSFAEYSAAVCFLFITLKPRVECYKII